jgi:4-amino-4-deoxy-L-arabinose transferase-like glycosyltransferase
MTNKRVPLITIFLTGGALILCFGIGIKFDIPKEQFNITWVLVVGFLLLMSGLVISWYEIAYNWVNAKFQVIGNWFGVTSWQILLLFISFIFVFLAAVCTGPLQRMYSPAFAVISWILSIVLMFLGAYRLGDEKPKVSKATISLMIIVTFIAFLFRGIATASIPGVLSGDEASAGISASQFVSGEWNNIFIAGWYSFPSFFSFVQSISIRIFGQTTEALRILSAIVGALTVAAVYLCGKAMFGSRAGILASLCLSALHFHIHFSRLGLNNIWDGLWYPIVIGALWYGWEHNHRIAYLIAGLALGISQYFYVSSKGLFGILLIGFLVSFFVQRIRLYQALPNLILMFAVMTAVIFPLVWFYLHEPNQFLAPIVRVSFLREMFNGPPKVIEGPVWKFAIEQTLIGVKAFTHTPIHHHYEPETPLLRPMHAILFYVGLLFLLLRIRDSRFVLLFLWLATFGLIGGLSESAPSAQRYVAAAPACALIIGFGVHKLIDVFERRSQKRSWLLAGLSYMIIVAAMINDLYFYFIEYESMDRIENIASHGTIAQQLANRLDDQAEGTQVAFFAVPDMGYYSIPSIQYLAPQVEGIDVSVPWKSFDKTVLISKHIVFVFLPGRENELDLIIREYLDGSQLEVKAWNNQTLFWLYDYSSK